MCHYLLVVVYDIVVFATVHIFIFIASTVDIRVIIEDTGGNRRLVWVSVKKSIKSTFHPHLERVLANEISAGVGSPLCPGLSDDNLSSFVDFAVLTYRYDFVQTITTTPG